MAKYDGVKGVLDDIDRAVGQRANLNKLLEEIAEVLVPDRRGFISGAPPADLRANKVFDTNPQVAMRGLINAIGAMLRPKTSAPGKWFDIVTEDERLMESRAVKEWIEHAESRMWTAIYNPRARFITATGEVDSDLVGFGFGAIYTGVRKDRMGMVYRGFHPRDIYVTIDGDGEINGIYIIENLTVYQAMLRWGKDKLGKKAQEALVDSSLKTAKTTKLRYAWALTLRHERDPRMIDNKNMPIRSQVIECESEHEVLQEGFQEMPVAVPRWDARSGEVYGRSPGIMALPDVATLQQMGKTLLRSLHRAVDPTWLLPSDSMVSAPNFNPGKVAYYDAKAIRNLGLTDPFRQMDNKARVDWGLNAQQAYREQIQAIFYRNILNLPVAGPDMTATEVLERKEEFVREIGAVFGRLESDYSGPIIERTFNIMLRNNGFLPPPDELRNQSINFRFASPVEKAKRQIEEAVVASGIDRILTVGERVPEVMDAVNWTEWAKFTGESHDFPPKLLNDPSRIEELGKQRAAMQQQEAQMQTMERGAAMAKDAGGAAQGLANALGQAAQQPGAAQAA